MSEDEMKASVIIPTYNGAHKIEALLNSLIKQTEKDFEVIIVIDGSQDRTEEILIPYKKSFKDITILVQDNKGRAKTRNTGAALAQSDLFIFYDDDMEVDADSVHRYIDFDLEMKGAYIVAGNQRELVGASDIQNYKSYLTQFWFSKFSNKITQLDFDNLFFAAANCAMPRSVFQQLNGFDERLSDVEDYDLAFRALKKKMQVFFNKNMGAVHGERITCISYITRLRQYSVAKKKWMMIQNLSVKPNRLSLKKILYLPFALRVWAKAIDQNFFSKLPKKIKYKLYDVVIQALAIEFPNVRLR